VPRGRPYRIAYLLTGFDVGGTERQMVELMRRLDRRTFEVHVACMHRGGPLEARALEGAASVATFPINGFARPSAVQQMVTFARWCRRIDAHIVHTCELYANVLGLPAAALARVPVRIGNRRELRTPDKRRAHIVAQRLAYRAAHLVAANSAAAAAQLRLEGVAANKIRVIPNGVDCDRYPAAPRNRPIRRIVTVANLREEKGHDTLILAASMLAERHPDLEICFIGDGPLRATLVRQVNLRGLRGRVQFLGERDDIPAQLAAADLFVLPSRTEASPNALIEAMASGLPIVASRVGGIPELIESGGTGVLVTADDPRAFAAAISNVVEHPSFAAALGRAARAAAERRFAFSSMIGAFERLYLTALDERAFDGEPNPELATS
jgi:glycosyltransferase involved in cell wall biosynthesis